MPADNAMIGWLLGILTILQFGDKISRWFQRADTSASTVAVDLAKLSKRFDDAGERLSDKETEQQKRIGDMSIKIRELELWHGESARDHQRYEAEFNKVWSSIGRGETRADDRERR